MFDSLMVRRDHIIFRDFYFLFKLSNWDIEKKVKIIIKNLYGIIFIIDINYYIVNRWSLALKRI